MESEHFLLDDSGDDSVLVGGAQVETPGRDGWEVSIDRA